MDRNDVIRPAIDVFLASLSARRAWIEMEEEMEEESTVEVALRKESVDRNTNMMDSSRAANWSLSARRAWIEIPPVDTSSVKLSVALRKESVDRNRHAISFSAGRE